MASPYNRLSRRQLLQAGLGAGLALRLAPGYAATASLARITKPIPSTGERLPVIGLGTIWYRNAQYAQLKAVLQALGDEGGGLIDTAAAYGESEEVIGKALSELGTRDKMFLATKFDSGSMMIPGVGAMGAAPPPAPPSQTPPGAGRRGRMPGPPAGVSRPERDGVGGRASFERSLKRLQTSQIDLLQVHGMNGTDELMPLMVEWKQDKKIRYLGVTTSAVGQHEQLVTTMRRYPLDFIQVDYSIDNRDAEQQVLGEAQKRGVAVLVNLPLGRATLLQKLANRPLPEWAADVDVNSWAQFLLKYVVSHPAVTCAIPGTTKVTHLQDNLLAGRGRLPDAAMRKRMEAFWDTLS